MKMRRAILGTCLTAMFAATAASVAAAAPPEFTPPFPNAFSSTSKALKLETVGKFKVTCKADTNSGEVTGPSSVSMTITFTGCKNGRSTCQNAGVGVIVTQPLIGTLGYVSRTPKRVGLDLSNPTGGPLMSFFCGEDVSVVVSGSAIAKVSPINKMIEPGAHLTLKLAQKEGQQAIKMLLGGPLDVPLTSILGGPPQESGIASTDQLTFATPTKVVA